jgi:hypothetical protein
MSDLLLGPAALEQVRIGVAAQARRVPALVDRVGVPRAGPGDLAAGPPLLDALAAVVRALDDELGAAGTRLDQVDRALDAALRAIQASDRRGAATLTAA